MYKLGMRIPVCFLPLSSLLIPLFATVNMFNSLALTTFFYFINDVFQSEMALTIQDRDLFKVDYMFVIKFFFKGLMGAFLELTIEIVS